MKRIIQLSVFFILLFEGCATYSPLYYSSKDLSSVEVERLFDQDSSVNEMKYFDGCIKQMSVFPIENWQGINKEGVVGVSVLIDTVGQLDAAQIFQSVHPALDLAAMKTVRAAAYYNSDNIINWDGPYIIRLYFPYYHENFDINEMGLIEARAYDEKMYDIAPEPEVGWEKAPLKVEYNGYSDMLRVEGETQITFCVDSKGGVGQFYVSKAFGYGAEEQAIEAIRKVQWKAATKAGNPVPCLVTIPFRFYYWY